MTDGWKPEKKGNSIARAEDFRQAAEAQRAEGQAPERLKLPKSALQVVLRRPSLMWFLFHGHLPVSLAARQSGAGGNESPFQNAEEFVEFSKWIVDLLSEAFVSPRLSLTPGADDISPEWLAEEDVNFIIRWALGEVVGSGSADSSPHDLAQFRGKAAGAASPSGAGG